jgi:hypothetical protein
MRRAIEIEAREPDGVVGMRQQPAELAPAGVLELSGIDIDLGGQCLGTSA